MRATGRGATAALFVLNRIVIRHFIALVRENISSSDKFFPTFRQISKMLLIDSVSITGRWLKSHKKIIDNDGYRWIVWENKKDHRYFTSHPVSLVNVEIYRFRNAARRQRIPVAPDKLPRRDAIRFRDEEPLPETNGPKTASIVD